MLEAWEYEYSIEQFSVSLWPHFLSSSSQQYAANPSNQPPLGQDTTILRTFLSALAVFRCGCHPALCC